MVLVHAPNWAGKGPQSDDTIHLTLSKSGQVWVVSRAGKHRPGHEELFIRGRVVDVWQQEATVEYGIESYFVPEGLGRELEKRRGHRLVAEVAVDGAGRSAIRGLRVSPEPPAP